MSLSDLTGASAVDSVFGTGLSQNARLITLASAQDSTLPQALMPEHFTGREAVNELFRFDIDALSTSTDLELADFIGEEITLKLLQPDGSRRSWHGICTDAAWLGADGGMARYRLRLEPGLALLGLRRDSYIFQDKNAQDLVTELLADYPQVRFEFDVTQTLAVRPIWTQYRESDLQFLQRVLAAEGLSWRFEHEQDGQDDSSAATEGQQQAKHKVVFFDSKAVLPDTLGGADLRFHGVRATDTDDAIDEFNAQRRIQANAVTISSWDPTQLVAPAAEQSTSLDIGDMPALSIYDGSAERRHEDTAAADPHSRLMLQALELDNKLFEGQGAVRRMAEGHRFHLTQHERYASENGFTTLWVEHEARNNVMPAMDGIGKLFKAAKAGIATLARFAGSSVENGTYRNRFGCVRDTVAIVPRTAAARYAGAALGPQTALVVGLPEAVNTTTREHQVRIQFAWQRGANTNAGGLPHNSDPKGNAPGNDASGTWVRVAEALAGPNWGSQFTPRIGTEVLVDFIEGDMDRPLVVAQLYTGSDTPPYAAGIDSGVNHAGVISGMHSNNFDGGGFNQWVVDDTPGQLRTRLATSSAATQLNLGYLVHQAPTSAQRGAFRGYGFELRTDAWGVVRSGEGLLISATARPQQGASVTSTQLDSKEAIGQLKSASELNKVLADAATQHSALSSKPAGEAQTDFIAQIDPEQKGKFEGAVGGHEPLKAVEGKRDPDSAAPVEKFAQPVVLMEAPASINWATPASTALFAGGQLQWTTQSDLHLAAGFTVASVSANATGLFTHAGGIQAIAGNGPVSLQAHTDQLEILADKAITVISVNDVIEVKANQKIVLQAGQSSVTLEGGNITFACPGNFTVKGGQHVFTGGASAPPVTAPLPDTRIKLFDEGFVLKDRDTGELMPRQPYRIKREDGTYETGMTDEKGLTHVVAAAAAEALVIELLNVTGIRSNPAPGESPARKTPAGSSTPAPAPEPKEPKFKAAEKSTTTPIEVKGRKEVKVKLPACWIDDYEKEIDGPSYGRYSQPFQHDGTPHAYEDEIWFKLHVPVKTNQPVVVEVRIKVMAALDPAGQALEAQDKGTPSAAKRKQTRATVVELVKQIAMRGITSVWNNKLKIQITDPQCGTKVLPIVYKPVWVDSGEHYVMRVHKKFDREQVSGRFIDVSLGTTEQTHAHEFGHCCGLPDEYSYTDFDETVGYFKPDGTMDKPVPALALDSEELATGNNIYNTYDSTVINRRHAWNIAIEVQELLTARIGRKIKCDIV